MQFNKEECAEQFKDFLRNKRILYSHKLFKIKLFLKKAEQSRLIAEHHKDINPTKGQPKKLYWNQWAITISYYSMLYAAKAAILSKGYEVKDHFAAQVALGYLFVPDKIQKEDLELLNQAYKIFEDEYIKYFEDARKESHTARYSAIKTYTEKRVEIIFENATKFIAKISLMLEDVV